MDYIVFRSGANYARIFFKLTVGGLMALGIQFYTGGPIGGLISQIAKKYVLNKIAAKFGSFFAKMIVNSTLRKIASFNLGVVSAKSNNLFPYRVITQKRFFYGRRIIRIRINHSNLI